MNTPPQGLELCRDLSWRIRHLELLLTWSWILHKHHKHHCIYIVARVQETSIDYEFLIPVDFLSSGIFKLSNFFVLLKCFFDLIR